jgi:hypothetical protein
MPPQNINYKQTHTNMMDSSKYSRDTWTWLIGRCSRHGSVKRRREHDVYTSSTCVQSRTLLLHWNRCQLLVKHLSTRILTRKHRTPTANRMCRHRKCLSVTSAHRAKKQLKLRPFLCEAARQIKEGYTASRIAYCHWIRSSVRKRVREY